MRKLAGAIVLAALPFVASSTLGQNAQKHYSIKGVENALARRHVLGIYFSTHDYSIHAKYISTDETDGRPALLFRGLRNVDETYRNLKPDDPKLRNRFMKAIDDDLIVRVCGYEFADEDCDFYGPRDRPSGFGKKIDSEGRQHTGQIINEAGRALAQARFFF